MANLIKNMENQYIKDKKEELKEVGSELSHSDELVMRNAYNTAAIVFQALGRHEGDERRKQKIIEALGLIQEEPVS